MEYSSESTLTNIPHLMLRRLRFVSVTLEVLRTLLFHSTDRNTVCRVARQCVFSPSMCLPRDITILPKYVTVLGPISERNNGRLDYQTCTTCIPYSNLLPPLAVSYFVTFSGNPGVGNVGFRSLNTRSSLPWKLDHTATGLLLVSATRNTNGSKKKKKSSTTKILLKPAHCCDRPGPSA